MNNFPDHLFKLLPARAQAKIVQFDLDLQAHFAAVNAFADQADDVRRRREDAAQREWEALSRLPRLSALAADEEIREREAVEDEIRNAVRLLDVELSRAREGETKAKVRLEEFTFLQTAVSWLHDVVEAAKRHPVRLEPKTAPMVKPGDHFREVALLRQKIEELNAEWAKIEMAPVPHDQAIEAAVAEIDAIAARGKPSINLRARDRSPADIARDLRLVMSGGGIVHTDPTPILAWALRETLIEKVSALIKSTPGDGAMTDAEREKALDNVAKTRLELERREEAHILAAAAIGQNIPRRPDADPRAVLEVTDISGRT